MLRKEIFEQYKSIPYYQREVGLENGYKLVLKWNVFEDKKDGNKPVIRVRYILYDKDNNRQSLKVLNLKHPVEFKQIELTDHLLGLLDLATTPFGLEPHGMLIQLWFGDWLHTEFVDMINSGDFKII